MGLDFFDVPMNGGEGAFMGLQRRSVSLPCACCACRCLLPPGNPARHCCPRSIIQEGQGGSGELHAGQLHLLEDVFRNIKDKKHLGTASKDLPSVPDQPSYLL